MIGRRIYVVCLLDRSASAHPFGTLLGLAMTDSARSGGTASADHRTVQGFEASGWTGVELSLAGCQPKSSKG
jgi:hypothetical protein